MPVPLHDVEVAALGLTAGERAYLVERLLDSLHGHPAPPGAPLEPEDLEARLHDANPWTHPWPVVRERLRRMLDP
jgi:hypothetical protein